MRVPRWEVWLRRWISVLALFTFTRGAWVGALRAGDSGLENPPATASAPPSQAPAVVGTVASAACPSCVACDPCGAKVHQGCLARYMASVGGFNCACRGSYKFPVPPQYTYHWPGMYSQSWMTAYNSPYRYPALKLPSWMTDIGSEAAPFGEAKPLTPSPGEGKPESPLPQ